MELSFLFSRLKAALRSFVSTSLSGRIVCSLSGSSREKIPNLAREFSVMMMMVRSGFSLECDQFWVVHYSWPRAQLCILNPQCSHLENGFPYNILPSSPWNMVHFLEGKEELQKTL